VQPANPLHFARYQASLGAHLRNPRRVPPEHAPQRPLAIYRELLFNNLKGFVGAAFPISQEILGEQDWDALVRDFYRQHRCRSPLFRDIAGEFLDWFEPLAGECFPHWPFLWSFMHYEWLELAVSISPQGIKPNRINPWGDLLQQVPVLNPSARLAHYAWPVHQIGPNHLPDAAAKAGYSYLLFRDQQDQVRFNLLNPLSACLIEAIGSQPGSEPRQSGRTLLLRLAADAGQDDNPAFIDAGAELLRQLRAQGALIGTQI
jgi:hypothetical protein